MARQARLAVPGQLHYVLLRGHAGLGVLADAADRALFVDALRAAAVDVAVHAVAMTDTEAHLLLRPGRADALGLAVQALGRRFVAATNRRHGRRGTPWDGRYRSAVVEPGAWSLAALHRVDRLAASGAGTGDGIDVPAPTPARWSDATLRPLLVDPPELWSLGNTPFERERAWAERLAQPLLAAWEAGIERGLKGNRVIGGDGFLRQLERHTSRVLVARPKGRPPGTRKVHT